MANGLKTIRMGTCEFFGDLNAQWLGRMSGTHGGLNEILNRHQYLVRLDFWSRLEKLVGYVIFEDASSRDRRFTSDAPHHENASFLLGESPPCRARLRERSRL